STSYYVTLKGKDGQETTQWGVGLKDALKGFRRGHEVSLELKESRPVQVRVRDENGRFSTREAVRNVWEATRIDGPQPKKSVETSKKDLMKGFQVVNSDDPTPDFS
ncbi:MobB relaxase/mobilization protein, partial [Salmonella enterica subsp. enterica]|nr:MobB relaxase/mobilization protein [Salmonella enterica subsp. enterica]